MEVEQARNAKIALSTLGAITLLANKYDIELVPQILKDSEPGYTKKAVVGSAIIYGFEKVIAKVLQDIGLKIPSSLGSMVSIFVLLKVIQATKGEAEAVRLAEALRPAVGFLGNWMTAFLAPPLASLPNNLGDVKEGKDWVRLAVVHFLGWLVSAGSTIAVARAIQAAAAAPEGAAAAGAAAAGGPQRHRAETAKQRHGKGGECPAARRRRLLRAWRAVTAFAFLVLPTRAGKNPALFATTVFSLVGGQSLPKGVTKVLHPLVTCGAITSIAAIALGRLEGMDREKALQDYFRNQGLGNLGPGDLFFGLLNASCCALGVRMFNSRRTLEANLPTLVGATAFSSMLSLFGTTWVAGRAGLPEKVSLMLSQRSVMSSLGIGGAQLLGASPALTVASILVTGVYGASVGKDLLAKFGAPPSAPLVRGLAMGATAHSIGTAALMEGEPEATAISSVALCLAGIIHTFVCAVPSVQNVLKGLASQA